MTTTTSSRLSHRRARSQSSTPSSSSPAPYQWRQAQKRVHPCLTPTHEYNDSTDQSTSKCGVDIRRRGKRARRESSTPMEIVDTNLSESSNSSPVNSHNPQFSYTSLPSHSEAFNFFPKTNNSSQPSKRGYGGDSGPSSDDLAQMHSEAFTDLRRSVAETGEGFVRRMREWEERRSYSGPSPPTSANLPQVRDAHPRKRLHKKQQVMTSTDSDEEEVEIFSVEQSPASKYHMRRTPEKVRALSLGRIHFDAAHHALPFANERNFVRTVRGRSTSPIEPESSAYTSDDEDMGLSSAGADRSHFHFHSSPVMSATTPALSFTFTNSANSSLLSLPLLPPLHTSSGSSSATRPVFGCTPSSALPGVGPESPSSPSFSSHPATRSEKAIAALTLALANGAGSVSDYEALRCAQGAIQLEDQYGGDLWD